MMNDFAILAARLVVGEGMAAHGAQKALGWFEGPGPEKAAGLMDSLGFKPGATYAPLAAWTEIVGGQLIALGLGGPLGPSMVVSSMIVAQAAVHWKNGFFATNGGIELGALYSAAALAFSADGYGSLSLDTLFGLRDKLKHPVVTTLVLAGAAATAAAILANRDRTPAGPATPTFRGKNSPLPDPAVAATPS
jgi:putative oxidoreductase